MTIKLSIPRLPESGNKIIHFSGWQRQEYRTLWHEEVNIAVLLWLRDYEASGSRIDDKFPFLKANVILTMYFPDLRSRDKGNYIRGCKPVLDGLVQAGIIEDDEYYPKKKCDDHYEMEYDKKHPRTEIIIEEVEE